MTAQSAGSVAPISFGPPAQKSPTVSDEAANSGRLSVHGQHDLLKEAFKPTPDTGPIAPAPVANPRITKGQLVKSAVAIAAAVFLGWTPAQRLLSSSSAEAVLNARLITLRAPIDGEIGTGHSGFTTGTLIRADQPLFSVSNIQADRNRLSDLGRDVIEQEETIRGLRDQIGRVHELRTSLQHQVDEFLEGRRKQLAARVEEIDAQIIAAQAQDAEAKAAFDRCLPALSASNKPARVRNGTERMSGRGSSSASKQRSGKLLISATAAFDCWENPPVWSATRRRSGFTASRLPVGFCA